MKKVFKAPIILSLLAASFSIFASPLYAGPRYYGNRSPVYKFTNCGGGRQFLIYQNEQSNYLYALRRKGKYGKYKWLDTDKKYNWIYKKAERNCRKG